MESWQWRVPPGAAWINDFFEGLCFVQTSGWMFIDSFKTCYVITYTTVYNKRLYSDITQCLEMSVILIHQLYPLHGITSGTSDRTIFEKKWNGNGIVCSFHCADVVECDRVER